MDTIYAYFVRLNKVSIEELINKNGVYVLWSYDAWTKPSYIGEGLILERIVSHAKSYDKPFKKGIGGVVSMFNDDHPAKTKRNGEIVEVTLLEAASILGVSPKYNSSSGKFASILKRGINHSTIRINIKGCHPLWWGNRINGTARFTWKYNDCEGWQLTEMPWRRRR